MKLEFVDLKRQYLSIKDEIDAGIREVIESGKFVGGKYITEFEQKFADFIGSQNCISCGNGTDALEIALRSLRIGNCDEVIVPANSFIATSEAVTRTGANVVFVDCDSKNYLMDISLLDGKITHKTKAIIAVHLYGQTVNMDRLSFIAKKHKINIIEDCAQAHGAKFNGKNAGTFGIASCFSFYPGKNLGAYGDGGAILTSSSEVANYCRLYSNHGAIKKYNHLIEGCNSRLDAIQAKILTIKLTYLPEWNQRRRDNASTYFKYLDPNKFFLPLEENFNMHIYHLFVIKCDHRDKLQQVLRTNGIETLIHYPIALPFLEAYKDKNYSPLEFPIAHKNQGNILSLPIFPELEEDEIKHICYLMNNFKT